MSGAVNDVPDWYHSNLDANNLRRDRLQRPELCRGSVDYVVGKEFMIREPMVPTYLFVLDVSYSAVNSGLIDISIEAVREALQKIAEKSERAKAGIITFNHNVQFYVCDSNREYPQLMVMTDIDDPFAPVPVDQLLVEVNDEKGNFMLESILDMIPDIYSTSGTEPIGSSFGATAMAAANTLIGKGGKIILMTSNIASIGNGKLNNRETSIAYNTEKEKELFVPQSSFYNKFNTECAENAISDTMNMFKYCRSCII